MLMKIVHFKNIIVQLNEGVFLMQTEGGLAFCFLCILGLSPCPEDRAIKNTAPVLRPFSQMECTTLLIIITWHYASDLDHLSFIFAIQQLN